MTSDEFRSIRHFAGMTQASLAEYLRVHWRTVAKYESGESPVPGPVQVLMESLGRGR